MRYSALIPRAGFHRAMVISMAVHVAIVAFIILCVMVPFSQSPTRQPGIDTRIQEVTLRIESEESTSLAPSETAPTAPTPPESKSTETTRPPTVQIVPSALPPELTAIIQKSRTSSDSEGPVASPADPKIMPAGASTPLAAPLHGAMKPGQSVVYILDCSGSMGEFGKLALARSALMATLQGQPEGVRYQVIPYNSTARLLLPGGFTTVTGNLGQTENKLAKLEAAGRSNHAEALRVAVGLRPDAIIWLTDADDFSAAKLKTILNGAGKPIPVYIAEVAARVVNPPKELR